MPGFTKWARQSGAKEPAEAVEECFVVTNDALGSKKANGLHFRRSPAIDDLAPRVASWGCTVRGVRHGSSWLKVGDLYLPFVVSGRCVLLREDEALDAEDELRRLKLTQRREELYHRFCPPAADDERPGDTRPDLKTSQHETAQEQSTRCHDEEPAGQEDEEDAEAAQEEDLGQSLEHEDFFLDSDGNPLVPAWLKRQSFMDAPAPEGSPAQLLLRALCGEDSAGVPDSPGHPYEALVEQETRQVPSRKARACGKVKKGQRLMLYKWDASGHWRTAWQEAPIRGWTWLETDDPEAGPLLKPVVPSPTTKRRHWSALAREPRAYLNPVSISVFEDDPGHLQSFVCLGFDLDARDAAGLTPLMLAAQWGLLDCCVLLLRGGASLGLAAPDGRTAVAMARDVATTALLEALSGEECFNAQAFDQATQRMRPELQEVAERMLEEVAAVQQERRRRAQDAANEIARIKAVEAKLLAERGSSGALFEVVAQFAIMRQEATEEAPIVGELPQGRVVELFDWSLDMKWRKCWHPLVTRQPPILYTWVMLDHPDQGPQLRPHVATTEEVLRPWPAASAATCTVPLQPVCTAVHENNLRHLQSLAIVGADVNAPDSQGLSPLMLAAQWGLYDCCVRLLHDGADAFQTSPDGSRASDLSREPDLKALIKWLSGEDPKLRCYSVLERLSPDLQECAEGMLKDLTAKNEARRKAEEEAAASARRERERRETEALAAAAAEKAAAAAAAAKQAAQMDVYTFDFLADLDRPTAYTLAELDEMKAKQEFEEQEIKVAKGVLEAWTCSDCAFQSPASSPVCVFCDTPRGGGLKEAHMQGRRVL